MPNTKLFFTTTPKAQVPKATTVNEAGGKAYKLSDKAALAQYALTGTFGNAFYSSAEAQLDTLKGLAAKAEPQFLAKLARYARIRGFMKDMPAALLAILTAQKSDYLGLAFGDVVDSPRVLRTYVQMVRSGTFGRKSFGSYPRRLIRQWLEVKSPSELFYASIGEKPSLVDVIKMVHPSLTAGQSNVVRYLMGKPYEHEVLPEVIREFEAYKKAPSDQPPRVPFEMLTGMPLTDEAWATVADQATWGQLWRNLNTFQRHNVLSREWLVIRLAQRLSNPDAVRRAKVMPYQLFTAWLATRGKIRLELSQALEQATAIALENIPTFSGQVLVALDTSGSMSSASVTGGRGSATSSTRCIQVAGLIGAAIKHANPSALISAFDTEYHEVPENALEGQSVLSFAGHLAGYVGGGTATSVPLAMWNRTGVRGDLVIYVSDNESWFDSGREKATRTMQEWAKFKQHNPEAKMVCIDLAPGGSTQAPSSADILNIGGWSDACFDVIQMFLDGTFEGDTLVEVIEQS